MHRTTPPQPSVLTSAVAGGLLLAAVALGIFGASGCSKPLLSPSEERSPFDRYDNVRGDYVPQYIEDKFGRRQPNLRARLSPKD